MPEIFTVPYEATLPSFGSPAARKNVRPRDFVLQGNNGGWVTIPEDEYELDKKNGVVRQRSVDETGGDVDWEAYSSYRWSGVIVTSGSRATITNEALTFADADYADVETGPDSQVLDGLPNDSVEDDDNSSDEAQSDNYVAGVSGYFIDRVLGDAEFNDIVARGTIVAEDGVIGGWTINSAYLAKDTGTNATSAGLAPLDYPFFAGATYANRASAPFRVTPAGAVVASSIDLAGGTVSGIFTVSGTLRSGAGNPRYALDATGLKGYDSGGTQRYQILNDGSGWLGTSSLFAWNTAGSVSINGITIQNGTIVGTALQNATITATQIANATITATQIASATITGTQIANATITATQIANATITGTQIASGTITSANIQNGTIVSSDIANATIVAANLSAGTITANEIANATIVASNIANLTITATQIANATITGAKIGNATIAGGNIAAATITGSNISGGTITDSNIQAATITGASIASATITNSLIVNATITGAKIASATITATNIAAGTITSTQIAASTITASNIAAGTITATQLSATAIDSMTITGATIRTASSGARTEMNASNLFGLGFGGIGGTDGTTTQWYARASNGKFYLAGGNIIGDADGLVLLASSVYANSRSIRWRDSGNTLDVVKMNATVSVGPAAHAFEIVNTGPASGTNFVYNRIYANGQGASSTAQNYLEANHNASAKYAFVQIFADAATEAVRLRGNVLFPDDNTYDVGADGATRPKNLITMALALQGVTTKTISGNDNNVAAEGISKFRYTASGANRNVTGFADGYDGKIMWVFNVGGSNNVVLSHQNANSSANNRILSDTGADISLTPGQNRAVMYDGTNNRWRTLM